jgi:two-component system, OmpR family, response regulator
MRIKNIFRLKAKIFFILQKKNTMRLLIVEDDKKISDPLKRGLEQETFSVDQAFDGESALDLISSETYDLVVLDLMLPKIDGIEVCKRIRSEKNPVPVLMLTAKSELEDKILGLNSGADDYLIKPFAFEELLARVHALLRRPKEFISSELICGDLTLNALNFSVYRENKEIVLSKREFSLLEYLMRNLGRTVTKEQIISHVWNYDADILPNTVEQYIGYLRSKIEKPFSEGEIIQTVRGFGYKLVCRK